jgi:5-(carboxyamino)imidazole ribonucleotide synthase
MNPLAPGETIGILGGGQLGRMLSMAAARLGFDCHIYAPEGDSCAARVAARTTVAAYTDMKALQTFVAQVAAVTFEFENVPVATVQALAGGGRRVFPGAKSLAIGQDRFVEKTFFQMLEVPTAPFAEINSQADLETAIEKIGRPAILKTRTMGYDGKGQTAIKRREDVRTALQAIGAKPAILEGFVPFEREVSVVAARSVSGEFAVYHLCENEHRNGVLAITKAPAQVSPAIAAKAYAYTRKVLEGLDHVGVLAVEYFLMPDGALLANEFAPRVHNSGHWTEDGCLTSQFEQHIRAVAGWPLGPTTQIAQVEMTNLIGEDVLRWKELAADPSARLHLYGKGDARPGRKMGHVNRLFPLE